jgi:hypothetical protein
MEKLPDRSIYHFFQATADSQVYWAGLIDIKSFIDITNRHFHRNGKPCRRKSIEQDNAHFVVQGTRDEQVPLAGGPVVGHGLGSPLRSDARVGPGLGLAPGPSLHGSWTYGYRLE